MIIKKVVVVPSLVILMLFAFACAYAGQVTLTTYYPAPYGEYRSLVTQALMVRNTETAAVGTAISVDSGYTTVDQSVLYFRQNNTARWSFYRTASGGTDYFYLQNYTLNNYPLCIDGSNGRIGIYTTAPSGIFDIRGQVYWTEGGAQWTISDARYKENIVTLGNPLDKISRLRGVEFTWKREEFKDKNFPEGKQIGVIAQEIEKEFPELVNTDAQGYKSVAYDKLSVFLLEAIKEQQKEIDVLKSRINELKQPSSS